ncbi:MAG: glycosyltransferase family 2 protein [Candidatus Woesearchaeota archaeon]
MKIAVVLPAYNEERSIGRVIDGVRHSFSRTLPNHSLEIIVVNDCSTDKTSAVALKKKVTLVNHSENTGYGGALITGFNSAKNSDIIVTLDSDGQHDPEELAMLLVPIFDKKADIVIGSRFLDGSTSFPLYRKLGILGFTALTNLLFGLNVTDCQSGLRAYRSSVVRSLHLKDTTMGISLEILAKVARRNYRVVEVRSRCDYSRARHSTGPISHGACLLKSLFVHYLEK